METFNAETQRIKAVASSTDKDVNEKEFEKRMKLAELSLKKQKLDIDKEAKKAEDDMVKMLQQETPNGSNETTPNA